MRSSLAFGLLLLIACGDDDSMQPDAATLDAAPSDASVVPDAPTDASTDRDVATDAGAMDASVDSATDAGSVVCDDPAFGETTDWRHTLTRLTVRAGSPHHSTQGPVVREGQPVPLPGKFAYGLVSKDLEGEDVRAFVRRSLHDCEWLEVGPAETDSDGRAILEAPAFSVPGLYEYILVVNGDHTTARGDIAVLAEDAELVVFDIDGTLTTDDGEVFEEVLLGGTAEMMEGANAVVQYYADRGIQPIYITGRPYQLQGPTRRWLATQEIPRGPLHTTDSVLSTIPGEPTENYKRAFLQSLVDAGFTFTAAYGNADTDICAYARVGIREEVTYIIGENAGMACDGFDPTQPITSYPNHLTTLP